MKLTKVATCETWVLSIVLSNGDTPWEDLFVQVEGEDRKIVHGDLATPDDKCSLKRSPTSDGSKHPKLPVMKI